MKANIRTNKHGQKWNTDEDIRIYKRKGKWYFTGADAYSKGPFSDADDMGPYNSLVECCVAIAAEEIPDPFAPEELAKEENQGHASEALDFLNHKN